MTLSSLIESRYGISPVATCDPIYVAWATDIFAAQAGAVEAVRQLRALNRKRERFGTMPYYPAHYLAPNSDTPVNRAYYAR